MSDLSIIQGKTLTMSSREIADLTGKEISHIHRDIRSMLDQLSDDPELDHVREDKDARGYTTCFHLTKNLSMTLVAGYNVKLRKAIIDRWQELEKLVAQPAIPQTLPEALRLAADLAEQKAQAEAKLAIAAPKAEALDRIAADDKAMTITQAAKVLGVKRETLTQWMHSQGWVYRQNGSWVAYDAQIKAGRLAYKEARYTDDVTNQEVYRPYCHITPKGLARLALEFGSAPGALAA